MLRETQESKPMMEDKPVICERCNEAIAEESPQNNLCKFCYDDLEGQWRSNQL